MTEQALNVGKANVEETEDIGYDEWDALLIEEWQEADPGALIPASCRFGEFTYAHENPVAWELVDESTLKGMSKAEVKALMASIAETQQTKESARHLPGKHNQATHGKGGGGSGGSSKVGLSDEKANDLAKRVKTPDGGFTVDPRTGKDVTSGFAVATDPKLSKEIDAKDVTGKTIQNYVNANKSALAGEGKMVGGWHDPDTGKVWLDVSTVTPDKNKAVKLAQDANQIAIFDLGSGKSINTGGTGRSLDLEREQRFMTPVTRDVVKLGDNCPLCTANNDPRNVPVHPHCNCEVVTLEVEPGVDENIVRSVEEWIRTSGNLLDELALDPQSMAVLAADDVRFGDIVSWRESILPYLQNAEYIAMMVEDELPISDFLEAAQGSLEALEHLAAKRFWLGVARGLGAVI